MHMANDDPGVSMLVFRCRLFGPHEHTFRGPHGFIEWYDAPEPGHEGHDPRAHQVAPPAPTEDATRALTDLRERVAGMKACAPDGDYIRWDVEHADPSLHYVNREGVIKRIDDAIAAQKGAS